LYAKARLGGVDNKGKISWVLSYVQGGVAEVWKDNVLDEIENGMSEVETMDNLFEKIRKEEEEKHNHRHRDSQEQKQAGEEWQWIGQQEKYRWYTTSAGKRGTIKKNTGRRKGSGY